MKTKKTHSRQIARTQPSTTTFPLFMAILAAFSAFAMITATYTAHKNRRIIQARQLLQQSVDLAPLDLEPYYPELPNQ